MRPLVCPEPDIKLPVIRYGGIHQGLTGARTMDVTGHRQDFELQINWLDQDEYRWLEALHARVVPGPYYLINPLKRNRLSLQASKMSISQSSKTGVRLPAGSSTGQSLAFPAAEVGLPGWSSYVWHWDDPSPRVTFDRGRPIPVLAGETITASIFLNPSPGDPVTVTLQLDWFDVAGETLTPTASAIELPSGWTRQQVTGVPPSGAVSCRFSMGLVDPDGAVYMAAPQVEAASAATNWEIGGASVQVLLDQFDTESRRFPYRNTTLKLLEA